MQFQQMKSSIKLDSGGAEVAHKHPTKINTGFYSIFHIGRLNPQFAVNVMPSLPGHDG